MTCKETSIWSFKREDSSKKHVINDRLEQHYFRSVLDAEMSEAILLEPIWTLFLKVEAILNATNSTKHLLFGDTIKFHVGFRGHTSWHDRIQSALQKTLPLLHPFVKSRVPLKNWKLGRSKFGHVDAKQCTGIHKTALHQKNKKFKENTVASPTSDRNLHSVRTISWGSPPPWHPFSMRLHGLSALTSSSGNSSKPWQPSPLGGFSASPISASTSIWLTPEGLTSAASGVCPATWKLKVNNFWKRSLAGVPFSRWTCVFHAWTESWANLTIII